MRIAPISKYVAVIPVEGSPIPAMSPKRQKALLAPHSAEVLLHAASVMLNLVEESKTEQLVMMLSPSDRRAMERWSKSVKPEAGFQIFHPLAIISALTIGLRSADSRGDTDIQRAASALSSVALRWNRQASGPNPSGDADLQDIQAGLAASNVWKERNNDAWCFWSERIVAELSAIEEAGPILGLFEDKAGLTLLEWFTRTLMEVVIRVVKSDVEPLSMDFVHPALQTAWAEKTTSSVDDIVESCRQVDARNLNPFDLTWQRDSPIVRTADGAVYIVWVGAVIRKLLPAGVAEILATTSGESYRFCAAQVGRAAEQLLHQAVESCEPGSGETYTPEDGIKADEGQKKCDYLLESAEANIGLEFTVASPAFLLSSGEPSAVADLQGRLEAKLEQAVQTLERARLASPSLEIAVLVLATPTAIEPILKAKLQKTFSEQGRVTAIAICHATDFLDLIEMSKSTGTSLPALLVRWVNSDSDGTVLDFWLGEHGYFGAWRKQATSAAVNGIWAQTLKRA